MFDNDTETTVNIPRLLDLGRWLTKEERKRRLGQPSEWDQNVWIRAHGGDGPNVEVQGDKVFWSCGTAACLAGHVALEDGGRPAFYDYTIGSHFETPVDGRLDTLSDSFMFFGNQGQPQGIDEHARQALGLDYDQSNQLFEGENDYDRVVVLISEFTGYPEGQLMLLLGAHDLPPNPDDDDEW